MKIASLKNNSLILKGNAIETNIGMNQNLKSGSLTNWDNGKLLKKDFFEDFTSLDNWTNQGLSTFKLVDSSLHTEAPANSWSSSPMKSAKHILDNPITGDFSLETELEWIGKSDDLAEIYISLLNSSGTVIAWAGMRDSWSATSGEFVAKIGSSETTSGQGSSSASGYTRINIVRKNGNIYIYEDGVLRNSGVNTETITSIELTNSRYQTYNGKTAIWNYVNIYMGYFTQGSRESAPISLSNAFKLDSSKVSWKEDKKKLLFNGSSVIQTEFIPGATDLAGGFSLETSVVFTSVSGTQLISGVFTDPKIFIGTSGTSWYIGCGNTIKTISSAPILANTRYDLKLEYDGSYCYFYVDENLVSFFLSTFTGTNANKFQIGNSAGSSSYFKGYILSASLETSSGTMGKWDLDEGVGNIAYDRSGKYNGEIIGATWEYFGAVVKNEVALSLNNGRNWGPYLEVANGDSIPNLIASKEAVFNGTNSYATMGNVHNFGNGSFSITGWFSSSNINHTGNIISKAEGSGQEKGYQIRVVGKSLHCILHDGSIIKVVMKTNEFIEAEEIYKFALVISKAEGFAILYINGEEVKRNTIEFLSSSLNVSNPFLIGGAFDTSSTYYRFNGRIGEIKVYDKALTPNEVVLEKATSGLVAHYPLDEGAGTIAYDLVDNTPSIYSGTYSNISWGDSRLNKKRDLAKASIKIKTFLSTNKSYFSPSISDLKVEVFGEGFSFSKNGDLYNKEIEEVVSSFSTDFSDDTVGGFPSGFGVEYGSSRCWRVEAVDGVNRLKVYEDKTAGSINMISSTSSPLEDVDVYIKARVTGPTGTNRAWLTIGGRVSQLYKEGPYSGYFLGICRSGGLEYVAMYRIETDLETGRKNPRLDLVDGSSIISLGSKRINNFDTVNSYNLRLRIEGNNIKGKIWMSTITEPSAWDFDYTDNIPLGKGYAGISNYQAFTTHGVIIHEYSHENLMTKKTKALKNKKLILEGILEEE